MTPLVVEIPVGAAMSLISKADALIRKESRNAPTAASPFMIAKRIYFKGTVDGERRYPPSSSSG